MLTPAKQAFLLLLKEYHLPLLGYAIAYFYLNAEAKKEILDLMLKETHRLWYPRVRDSGSAPTPNHAVEDLYKALELVDGARALLEEAMDDHPTNFINLFSAAMNGKLYTYGKDKLTISQLPFVWFALLQTTQPVQDLSTALTIFLLAFHVLKDPFEIVVYDGCGLPSNKILADLYTRYLGKNRQDLVIGKKDIYAPLLHCLSSHSNGENANIYVRIFCAMQSLIDDLDFHTREQPTSAPPPDIAGPSLARILAHSNVFSDVTSLISSDYQHNMEALEVLSPGHLNDVARRINEKIGALISSLREFHERALLQDRDEKACAEQADRLLLSSLSDYTSTIKAIVQDSRVVVPTLLAMMLDEIERRGLACHASNSAIQEARRRLIVAMSHDRRTHFLHRLLEDGVLSPVPEESSLSTALRIKALRQATTPAPAAAAAAAAAAPDSPSSPTTNLRLARALTCRDILKEFQDKLSAVMKAMATEPSTAAAAPPTPT